MTNLASPRFIEVNFSAGKSGTSYNNFSVSKFGNISGDLTVTTKGGTSVPVTKLSNTSYRFTYGTISNQPIRYYFNFNGVITNAILVSTRPASFYLELSRDEVHIPATVEGIPYNYNNAISYLKLYYNNKLVELNNYSVNLLTQNVTAQYDSSIGAIKITDMLLNADKGYVDIVVSPNSSISTKTARYSSQLETSLYVPIALYDNTSNGGFATSVDSTSTDILATMRTITGDLGTSKSKYTIVSKLGSKNSQGSSSTPQVFKITYYGNKVEDRLNISRSKISNPSALVVETYIDTGADELSIPFNGYWFQYTDIPSISVSGNYKYYIAEVYLYSTLIAKKLIEVVSDKEPEKITVSLGRELLFQNGYKETVVRVFQGQEELTWAGLNVSASAGTWEILSIVIPLLGTPVYTRSSGKHGVKGVLVDFGLFTYDDSVAATHDANYFYYHIVGFKKDGTPFSAVKQQSRYPFGAIRRYFNLGTQTQTHGQGTGYGDYYIEADIAGDAIVKKYYPSNMVIDNFYAPTASIFYNGVLLTPAVDYTVTSYLKITADLTEPAIVGDSFEVIGWPSNTNSVVTTAVQDQINFLVGTYELVPGNYMVFLNGVKLSSKKEDYGHFLNNQTYGVNLANAVNVGDIVQIIIFGTESAYSTVETVQLNSKEITFNYINYSGNILIYYNGIKLINTIDYTITTTDPYFTVWKITLTDPITDVYNDFIEVLAMTGGIIDTKSKHKLFTADNLSNFTVTSDLYNLDQIVPDSYDNINLSIKVNNNTTTTSSYTLKLRPVGDISGFIDSRKTTVLSTTDPSIQLNNYNIANKITFELTKPLVNLTDAPVIDYAGANTQIIGYYYLGTALKILSYVASNLTLSNDTFTITSVIAENITFSFSPTANYNSVPTYLEYFYNKPIYSNITNWATFNKLHSNMQGTQASVIFNIAYKLSNGVTGTTSLTQTINKNKESIYTSRLEVTKHKQQANLFATETFRMTPEMFRLIEPNTNITKLSETDNLIAYKDLYIQENNTVYIPNTSIRFSEIYTESKTIPYAGTITIVPQAIHGFKGSNDLFVTSELTATGSEYVYGYVYINNIQQTSMPVKYRWYSSVKNPVSNKPYTATAFITNTVVVPFTSGSVVRFEILYDLVTQPPPSTDYNVVISNNAGTVIANIYYTYISTPIFPTIFIGQT